MNFFSSVVLATQRTCTPWSVLLVITAMLALQSSALAQPSATGEVSPLPHVRENGQPTLVVLCHEGENPMTSEVVAQVRSRLGPEHIFVVMNWPSEPRKEVAKAQAFLSLADKYETRQLPELLLFDPQSRIYGQITHDQIQAGKTTEAIDACIKLLEKRDQAFVKAETRTGIDRATALHEALQNVEPYVVQDYRPIAEEIIALHSASPSPLSKHYMELLDQRDIDEFIQNRVYPLIDAGQYVLARQAIEEAIKTWVINPDTHQVLLGFQAQLYYSEGNRAKALELLARAIELKPQGEGAEKLRKAAEQINTLPDV